MLRTSNFSSTGLPSYAVALGGTLIAVGVSQLYAGQFGNAGASITLILAVAASSRWCGPGPGLTAALSGAIASYAWASQRAPARLGIGDLVSALALVGVSLLISGMGRALEATRAEVRERELHLREQLERNLQQQSFIDAATSSYGLGVFAVDTDGVFTFFNPAAADLLGWEQETLLGRMTYPALFAGGDLTGELRNSPSAQGLLTTVERKQGRLVLVRKSGERFPVTATAAPLRRNGETIGAILLFRDDSEQQALQDRLLKQAFHDPVTGLPNRALFLNRLEQAIRNLERQQETLAVLFLDLDHFKAVNDSLGHSAGDELLCDVGARFQECLRKCDTLARFGGDEFTALLVGVRDSAAARLVAQRFIRQLERPFVLCGQEVKVSVSIGVAISDAPTVTAGDFLQNADVALYRAKSSGRGKSVIFDDTLLHSRRDPDRTQ